MSATTPTQDPPKRDPESRNATSDGPRSRSFDPNAARRAWIRAGLIASALLVLPLLALLFTSRPSGFAVASASPRATAAAPAEDRPAQPAEPVRKRPKGAPSPAASAAAPSDSDVVGTVLDEDGQPIFQASIVCTDRDDDLVSTTDPTGHFRFGADAAGCKAIVRHTTHSASDLIVLAAGRDNVIRLKNLGSIVGTIVDEHGQPVTRFKVGVESFTPSNEAAGALPGMIVKAVSDTTGSFRLDNLPPGRYVLAASGPSRPPARSDNVDLDAGRTVTTKITVPLGAKLSGRVMDGETHKPIAGASVVLDATAASGVSAIPPANTDANGQYALEGVPPTGPFSIRVEHDSYRTKIVPGLTARGATMTQDVELSKAGDGGRDTEMPGIGAVLIARGKNIIIQTIVPGAPGEKAGLEEGDVITRVDGQSTDGWTVSDAIQHLRGPEKTRVSVQVNRKGQPVEVVVTRANFVR